MESDRKMFQGDWKCGKCGAAITELPFEPREDRLDQLTCRDCFMKGRSEGRGSGGGERKMFQGNWSCGKCGAAITELPFDPDPSRLDQLTCRECHRKSL